MDSDKRIENLETEVKHLRELVQLFLKNKDDQPTKISVVEDNAREKRESWTQDIQRGAQKILGGEAGESLESRVGGIWLSYVAVVLLMTTLALGAAVTFRTGVMEPFQKMAVGYLLATIAMAYGVTLRERRHLFPQTMLGAGLAILYFTTYASFYIEATQVFSNRAFALPALLACLVVLSVIAHLRKSQTAAGISLFLIYYTVIVSCWDTINQENITYALTTCAMLAAVALVFHVLHRWLLFTWAALSATHLTYMYFFLYKPATLDMSDQAYFWVSNSFLTLCYVLFSIICITDGRKTGEFRKTVAPMAGVNSFIFFALTWLSIREVYPAQEWMFRSGFAAGLAFFSLLAAVLGPRRNYLYQIFVAKTVIMITLALQASLSHEWLLVVFAIECLGLAFSYKRAGLVVFKALGLGLMLITLAGCLVFIRNSAPVSIGEFTVPANWFSSVGVCFVFCIVAWFYTHFIRRIRPEDRAVKGQWFLADGPLDVRSASVSMFHAAIAAFLLMGVTVLELTDDPRLPYILVFESIILAVVGYLLRTPQVEVASVLPLIAAHVCYQAFLWTGAAGFQQQPNYALYTALAAIYTFFGAHLWERYLSRIKAGAQWEHDLAASVPYLAATFMLTSLIDHVFPGIHSAPVQNGLAVAILIVAIVTGYTGMKIAGLVTMAVASVTFYQGVTGLGDPISMSTSFLIFGGLFLVAFALSERLLVLFERRVHPRPTRDQVFRTVVIVVALLMGLLGLQKWALRDYLTFNWLGLAAVFMIVGALFRESRYRWGAMAIFLIAIGRAFLYDLQNLTLLYKFLSFAALTCVLLPIAWAYSRRRLSSLRKIESHQMHEAHHDG